MYAAVLRLTDAVIGSSVLLKQLQMFPALSISASTISAL